MKSMEKKTMNNEIEMVDSDSAKLRRKIGVTEEKNTHSIYQLQMFN